jgi:hypothetical protein
MAPGAQKAQVEELQERDMTCQGTDESVTAGFLFECVETSSVSMWEQLR